MNSRDPVVRPGIDIHQYYTLDVISTASAALADIYSFKGTRGMGGLTKYTIQFTHPQRDLPRSDYINKMASFVIQPPLVTRWSSPEEARRVYGVITSFREKTGIAMPASLGVMISELEKARSALGPIAESAFQRGRAMSLPEAVACALGCS